MKPRFYLQRLVLPGLLVACGNLFAQSAWQPELVPVEGGGWTPASAFQVAIPALLSTDEQGSLAMELDGVDYSGVMTTSQNLTHTTLSVRPPEPLPPGDHELRLVVYTDDGEILERGAWQVTVLPAAGFSMTRLNLPTDVEIGYRFDEEGLDEPDDRLAATGNVRLRTDASAGQWTLDGNADLLLQTDHDTLVAGLSEEGLEDGFDLEARNDIELGEYLFQGKRPGLDAVVGHHELSGGSLLVSDFNRRGVSVNSRVEDGRLGGSVFAFRTEPVVGWNHGLGIGDEENRVLGAMATLRPLSDRPQRLSIQAMALRGEGNDSSGIGISGDDTPGSGDGFALAVESRLTDDRIRLRGEVARSEFDGDTTDGMDTEQEDDAARLLAEVIAWRDSENRRSLSLGAEYQRVDRFFRSLANPTLPNDREMRRVFAGLGLGDVDLRMQYARENNNADGEVDELEAENRIREILLAYSPRSSDGSMPWYGQPAFTAGWRTTRTRGVPGLEPLPGFSVADEDLSGEKETPYYQVGLALQHERWGVDLGFAQGDEESLLTGTTSAGSKSQSLGFHWIPGPRLFIFAQWLQDRFDNGPGLPVLDTELLLLNAEIGILPNRLSLVLDASLNQNSSDSDLLDDETRTLGLGIDWQPDRPGMRRYGTTLWIRAEHETLRDRLDAAGDDELWQVLAGVRITLGSGSTE